MTKKKIIFLSCVVLSLGIAFQKDMSNTAKSEEAPAYTDERAEWQAMYFGTSPDLESQRKTNSYIKRKYESQQNAITRDAGINAWEILGPFDVGGRIIGADMYSVNGSNKIFVGGVAGGIYKSDDGGSSWEQVTLSTMAYPVSSIAIHPEHQIIIATTGEILSGSLFANRGIGILRSDDGGSTWTEIDTLGGEQPLFLSRVVFNPLDASIVYACGYSTDNKPALYRSNDEGITWNLVYKDSSSASTYIRDFEINTIDTSIMYISLTGATYDVRKSTDSGNTFTSELGTGSNDVTTVSGYNGMRSEIALCSEEPWKVYLLRYLSDSNSTNRRSEIWRSDNSGDSWDLIESTQGNPDDSNSADNLILKDQGDYDNTLWVDPSTCEDLILGGINVWKYEDGDLEVISNWRYDIDGGGSLNNSVHADQHFILPDPNYDRDDNSRVYICNDGGLYKADDIWSANNNIIFTGWEALNEGLPITQLYSVDVSLDGNTIGAGSQDNSWFTTANGNSAPEWTTEFTGDGGHGLVLDSNPDKIIGSTQRGNFRRSTDGGASYEIWTSVSNYDNPIFIAPIEISHTDNIAYIAGTRLYSATTEDEPTITEIKSALSTNDQITAIEVAEGNGNIIYVGYRNGQIWKTENMGATWTNLNVTVSGNMISDIAIHPSDHSKIAYTISGGYTSQGCYFSDDSGTTWSNISLPTSMLYFSCTFHPTEENWIYIGTAKGIFASEDNGNNWSITPLFTENEGPIFAAVVEIIWQGNGSDNYPYHLVAATHGRGIYRTAYPIRSKYYVDKNCTSCGTGSWEKPYSTFLAAVNAAGSGSEIVFKTGGTYDEVSSELLLKKRIKLKLHPNSTNAALIK